MKMIYDVDSKPPFKELIVFAFQQLLAIITATMVVPVIITGATGVPMSSAAALLGAGFGTLVYILFTKKKSPVFLGSSFAFISPMIGAAAFGFWGFFIGAVVAGLVYVAIALIIKAVGSAWVNKLLPPVVIGPIVALIGLSLAVNAIGDITKASGAYVATTKLVETVEGSGLYHYVAGNPAAMSYNLIAILCGLITLFTTILCSAKGSKKLRLIPFIVGILVGYAAASIFTAIGYAADVNYLKIVDFGALKANFTDIKFTSFFDYPRFAFLGYEGSSAFTWTAFANILLLYAPVAFVVLAEHIADHKNISSIIERDLITDPGLDKTLLGDGIGSMVGAVFGACPNTTYGESIGCVAITKNASVLSIIGAAIMAVVLSFFSPFTAFVNTIPSCVLGGVCMALYGFIAVSGLKMLREVDLGLNKNLYVVSSILIAGIGGLALKFGKDSDNPVITITSIATALILGIVVNTILKNTDEGEESTPSAAVEAIETPVVDEAPKAE